AKGCIYLGIISDLTEGPFKALAVPITDAQKAFWKRVNQSGGIGG
ncbi:MAG TPA: branched-chain amino acid ABC transporter substrate-binding protein, partial [Micromonosporaceae bacterium]|nr:branched-chain amino acid ABC transporter substrate-binding protein [Micromonosporaceae bacterium]